MKNKTISHIFSLFCVIVWGTTFLSTKVLLKSFDPVAILIYRLIICIALLFIFSPKLMRLEKRVHELYFLGAGASGICFYFLFENFALKYTQASNVGVIVSLAPMFTMLFCSIAFKNQKIKWNFIIGFVVAIIGIVLISFNGNKEFGLSPKGDILALIAMMMWGIYSIFTYKISSLGYGGVATTRRIMVYGFITLIPFIFFLKAKFNIRSVIEIKNLLNLMYLGIFASTLCFLFWNFAVREIGPIKTSIYLYISPAITMLASYLIIHERINFVSIIGMLLSIFGLVLSGDILIKRSNKVEDKVE